MGHSNPVLRPVTGSSGNNETTSPACVGKDICGGAIKTASPPHNKMQGLSARCSSV